MDGMKRMLARWAEERRLAADGRKMGSRAWADKLHGWFDDVSIFQVLPGGRMLLKELGVEVPGSAAEWMVARNHAYPVCRQLLRGGGRFVEEGDGFFLEWDKWPVPVRFRLEADTWALLRDIALLDGYRFTPPADGEGTLVFDIGMNVGFASLALAAMCPGAEVYGFEPFPKTFERARRNFQDNPDLARRIHPLCVALSDHEGEEEWNFDAADAAMSSQFADPIFGGKKDGVKVRLESAAAAMGAIADRHPGWPCIVKMDCEGGEYAIFEDWAASGLDRRIDLVMMEYHEIAGHTLHDVERWFREHGFCALGRPLAEKRTVGMLVAMPWRGRRGAS